MNRLPMKFRKTTTEKSAERLAGVLAGFESLITQLDGVASDCRADSQKALDEIQTLEQRIADDESIAEHADTVVARLRNLIGVDPVADANIE